MPEGHQDHGRVPEAIAVILRRLDQAFDLRLGQMLPRPQLLVGRPFRSNCSIYGGWRDQPQARFGHGIADSVVENCSNNVPYTTTVNWLWGRSGDRDTCAQSPTEAARGMDTHGGCTQRYGAVRT